MFSYIITHRGDDHHRSRNLKATVSWIKSFKEHDIEIIVIDQDTEKRIELGEDVHHLLAFNSGIFSRSWGFNVGAKICKGDFIIFGDSDVVHKQNDFNEFLHKFSNQFQKYDVVSPYNSRVIFLNDDESEIFKESFFLPSNIKPGRGKSPFMGGVSVMKKECFLQTGGWDENFIGWGGEDCSYRDYLNALGCKCYRDNYQGYHLYHDRDKKQKTLYRQQHQKNRDYYFSVYRGKSLQHIQNNRVKNENIGDINKYK